TGNRVSSVRCRPIPTDELLVPAPKLRHCGATPSARRATHPGCVPRRYGGCNRYRFSARCLSRVRAAARAVGRHRLHRNDARHSSLDSAPLYFLRAAERRASAVTVRGQRARARPELRGVRGRKLPRRPACCARRAVAGGLCARPDTGQSTPPDNRAAGHPTHPAAAHERFHFVAQRFFTRLGTHDGGTDRCVSPPCHRNLRLFWHRPVGSVSVPSPWSSVCAACPYNGGAPRQGAIEPDWHAIRPWRSPGLTRRIFEDETSFSEFRDRHEISVSGSALLERIV